MAPASPTILSTRRQGMLSTRGNRPAGRRRGHRLHSDGDRFRHPDACVRHCRSGQGWRILFARATSLRPQPTARLDFASSTGPASTYPTMRAWCWTSSSATPTGPRIRSCSGSPEGPSLSLSARWPRPVASGSTRPLEAFGAALVPAGSASLSLTALIFSVMKEVQAAESFSQGPLLNSLDDDNINPKDLQLNGTIELFMKNGGHYTLDDPSQTIVINGSGSLSVATNSATTNGGVTKIPAGCARLLRAGDYHRANQHRWRRI